MKAYENYLLHHRFTVEYISTTEAISDIRQLLVHLKSKKITRVRVYDPCDNWLEKRIREGCMQNGIEVVMVPNPLFINSTAELASYQEKRKRYFQTDFYIHQRRTRKILVDASLQPLQGKWSFDAENRLKYPASKIPPAKENYLSIYHQEAAEYIEQYFAGNYGEVHPEYFYPADHDQAETALAAFLKHRFDAFGNYEDAIVQKEMHLHHSVLSPLINAGLLLPVQVVERAIEYATETGIPFNSLEGFVRQVLGWREFIRMLYLQEGSKQRTRNYWGFSRKIPASFYTGTTGIEPIDSTIKKLIKSGYNHHIERLMILGNFMLLCEFDPCEVYKWFMEMYIDSYDWVMVPNVYGMSQFADGGLMCTKPYISGSNYIFKMSDYKKGKAWAPVWDALFWRFLHVHRSFFVQNPRLGMLVKTFDAWTEAKQKKALQTAEDFLSKLDK